jgi:pectate lyase
LKARIFFKPTVVLLLSLCVLTFSCISPAGDNPGGKNPIPVEEVTINSADLILKTGTKIILTVSVSPDNADNKAVIWSSNSGAAAIDEDTGELTAKAVGSAIIKAMANDGSGIWSRGITVTVTDEAPALVEEIIINGEDDLSLVAEENKKLSVTVLPVNAGNKNVIWESNDPETVRIVNQGGEIKAVKAGTATITATAQDGSEAYDSIRVTVFQSTVPQVSVSSVNVNGGNFSLVEGRSRTLSATVLPADATDKTLEWSSDNPAVAAVNSATGVVTAKATGTANILATAQDGSEKSGSVNVTVTERPSESYGSVNILESEGWLESLYVKWEILDSADSYNVYCKGGQAAGWKKIDDPLIRGYETYFRADILGLAAGDYQVKVLPVNKAGSEYGTEAVTPLIGVLPHDRSGFAFSPASPNKTASGAYNDDGTLKTGAQILYLTAANVKTIELAVKESDKKTTMCVGIGDILAKRQKGYDSTPLAVRIIGTITASDMSGQLNSLSLLDFKGNKKGNVANITVEGIGNDATAYGWGIHIRSYYNLEVRNLGFMMFPDDGVSLEVDNQNIWVHNNDFFYGKDGGGDKNKGDGSLDSKTSGYTTMSYNHFWDSGKCNLLGNGVEPAEYLTYHHNWYDHSDSRHPRVRFHSVHVYNNYYDGVSKYGIGATRNSSIFAEGNYFRNSKNPMLISMQGTDTKQGMDEKNGTFSSEDGGMIKAYNNYMEGVSVTTYKPWSGSNTVHFDAYEVTDKSITVPDTVRTKQGGFAYNNFDTSSVMYAYTADAPAAARDKVIQYAGRAGGKSKADFTWTFTAADDSNYDRSGSLDAAIKAYKSKLVSIQGGGSSASGSPENPSNPENPDEGVTGPIICTFTSAGGSNSFFSITGNYSKDKGTVIVNNATYNYCVKIESSTNIAFNANKAMTLTLVFGLEKDSAAGKNIKIDGVNQKIGSDGKLTVSLAAGSHAITKGDTVNLFYISLSE